MTSFPTGLLRFAGNWDAGTTYLYGMYVIASNNIAYGCGATSDMGTDPTVQPSDVWFPYPQTGGGGSPSTWSTYPATADLVMGAYKIVDSAAGGDSRNTISMTNPNKYLTISALEQDGSSIVLKPAYSGGVVVGTPSAGSIVAVNYLQNLNGVGGAGAAGQLLSHDGSQILWINPIYVEPQILESSTDIAATGTNLLTSTLTPASTSSATVIVTINYQSVALGINTLEMDLKYTINGANSTLIDVATVSNTGQGNKGSCTLTGLILTIAAGDTLAVFLSATASGAGQFTVERASMLVQYNMAPQP
jgi:hypothetical protein